MEKADREEVLAELADILRGVEEACCPDGEECDQVLGLLEAAVRQCRHKRLVALAWRETMANAEVMARVAAATEYKDIMLSIHTSTVLKFMKAKRGYSSTTSVIDRVAIRAYVDEYLNPTHKE
jgi:hypothetical protein